MAYHKIIGIDLGTTFSVVSTINDETGKPEAFEVPGMQPPRSIFPSVVSVSRQGKILVGWPAKRNLPANPLNTSVEIKRKMGDDYQENLAGQKFSPQMISAMILTELKKIAEERIGEPVHDAVITVPAYFNDVRRKATEDAARIAQLNPRLLINEPTAAAVAYGLDKLSDEERIFIVYDLGGGTFDVSVIQVLGATIEVMGTAGDDQLGGGDFDNRLRDWVFSQIEREYPGSTGLRDRPDLRARIKAVAEQAKIDLSGADNAVIDLPNLTTDINAYYEIDRESFLALLQQPLPRPGRKEPIGLLDETIESVIEAFQSAKRNFKERYDRDISMDDITEFLLVGGSTRIPAVKQMLEDRFKKPVRFDPDIVDKAVSMGAAIMARTMDPMNAFEGEVLELPRQLGAAETPGQAAIAQLGVIDVTGHSLGIGIVGDRFHRLINKDTELPTEVTHEEFTTAADNQNSVKIAVFQGEDVISINNTLIGDLVIDGLEPRPTGYHMFDVTFKLDISGVLGLKVKHYVRGDLQPPKIYDKVLQSSGVTRLSREEVIENRRRIQQLLEQGIGTAAAQQNRATATPPPYQSMPFQPPYTSQPPPSPSMSNEPPPPFAQQPVPQEAQPEPAPNPQPQTSAAATAPVEQTLEAQIPEEFRDIWKKANERLATLEGARRQILRTTMEYFEKAVSAQDQAAISDYGKTLVETYLSMLR